MTAPRFSIVTPCLNRAATIEAAIGSVLAQAHPAVEHIVVDGGSTDGLAEILARYPHLVVIREPNRNLYDAINKGLRRATGDIIGLLNSGDLYAPGAFAAAEQALADPGLELVIGEVEFFSTIAGEDIIVRRLAGEAAVGLTLSNVIGNLTVMNAAFLRRSLFDRIGPFDDRFPLAADKDFWLRLVLAAPRHSLLPQVVYRYRSQPGSLTFAGDQREELSSHTLAVARTRFVESPSGAARTAYRRWHAWALGYRAAQLLRQGEGRAALLLASAGWVRDPLWPARCLGRIPRHWWERAARRGSAP
jgi:glycosyltransferase involved in cell wall biosynthesis